MFTSKQKYVKTGLLLELIRVRLSTLGTTVYSNCLRISASQEYLSLDLNADEIYRQQKVSGNHACFERVT